VGIQQGIVSGQPQFLASPYQEKDVGPPDKIFNRRLKVVKHAIEAVYSILETVMFDITPINRRVPENLRNASDIGSSARPGEYGGDFVGDKGKQEHETPCFRPRQARKAPQFDACRNGPDDEEQPPWPAMGAIGCSYLILLPLGRKAVVI